MLFDRLFMCPHVSNCPCFQVLFDQMKIDRLFIAYDAVLALYATGRQEGLVVDVGHKHAYAVPIVKGEWPGSCIVGVAQFRSLWFANISTAAAKFFISNRTVLLSSQMSTNGNRRMLFLAYPKQHF